MTRTWLVAVATVLLAGVPGAAAAHDPATDDGQPQPDAAVQHNCREVLSFPPDIPAERAERLVPDEYRDEVDGEENASLLLNMRRCERLTIDGKPVPESPVIDSYLVIGLRADGLDPPHHGFLRPCASATQCTASGLEGFNAYLVQWITNSQEQATWLKQRTGLGDKVRLVPGLTFSLNDVTGEFHFKAPGPAPSPFHTDATVTEPGPLLWDAAVNYWAQTDQGTVILFADHYLGADNRFGAGHGTVFSDDPSSPLGQLFGEKQDRALTDPVRAGFASASYGDAQWTKCVLTDTNECTDGMAHR